MATGKKKTAGASAPAAVGGTKSILIPPLRTAIMELWVIGKSPLIVHAWSKEARDDMLRKQMGLPTQRKRPKNPQQQIDASFYHCDDGAYGIHASAFKQAAVGACRFVDAKMTEARGMFFVLGRIVPIYGADPVPREDMVRLNGSTADIRYRPMFEDWACKLVIEYDASVTSPDQLANLFNRAGMAPGIGEWRPEKNGDFGRFRVALGDEWKKYEKRIPRVGAIVMPAMFEDQITDAAAE